MHRGLSRGKAGLGARLASWLGALGLGVGGCAPAQTTCRASAVTPSPVAAAARSPAAAAARSPAARAQPGGLLRIGRALCHAEPGDWSGILSPRFARAASVVGLRARFRDMNRRYGGCLGVRRAQPGNVVLSYARARLTLRLALDAEGRISGLWIGRRTFPGDTWSRLLADLRKLPGRVAFVARAVRQGPGAPARVARPGSSDARAGATNRRYRTLAALFPDRTLAVASTFAIFVLKAIWQEIRDGRMRWDDVVQLRRAHRSLPSAPLNRWPDGTPMTVQSLATFMIARSDNTATDHLLLHVGRQVVEHHAGTYNRPLLTTREMFLLKSRAHRDLARRWIEARTPAARRALLPVLARLARRSVDPEWPIPRLVDRIEWFFSAGALCDGVEPLARLSVFRVNPGLAERPDWRLVAHKGGSEPGVRSAVYAVQHASTGRWACVALVWNDPSRRLDRSRFRFLVRRALALVHRSLGRR